MLNRHLLTASILILTLGYGSIPGHAADPLPIADAHVHYSHDSVEMTPPERVVEIMREANLKFALVSSSDDDGTQLLRELAPDLIVPGLRPYSKRGQTGSWYTSEANLAYVEDLLARNRYASIGEFHLFGEAADLPIPRRIVKLAAEHNLILHAHSDAEAVERLLAQHPDVKVIWAHSGFGGPDEIAAVLDKHDRVWADLAFRSDVGSGGKLDEKWIEFFTEYPDRMMLGTDTYTPERMYFIPAHASNARSWLSALPQAIAERIAWKNAYDLVMPVWEANRNASSNLMASEPVNSSDHQESVSAQSAASTGTDDAASVSCEITDAPFSIEESGLSVSIEPQAEIDVSEPFPVILTVCGDRAGEAQITLDANMPAHGHGMNYAPTHEVMARSDVAQQIRVDGVVLHMPGNWEWTVDVQTNDARSTLTQEFVVQ